MRCLYMMISKDVNAPLNNKPVKVSVLKAAQMAKNIKAPAILKYPAKLIVSAH
jgi:hypothetical protein